MASDYLLEIDGIKGESKDSKHPGSIEILSFSWGVSQLGTGGTGGTGGAGARKVEDFSFTADVSKASPSLMLHCATGTHFKEATLYVRRSNPQQLEYMQYKLEDVLISSYQTCGSGNEIPTDQFSLNFAKIEFSYRPLEEDGKLGPPVTAGFNVDTADPQFRRRPSPQL